MYLHILFGNKFLLLLQYKNKYKHINNISYIIVHCTTIGIINKQPFVD